MAKRSKNKSDKNAQSEPFLSTTRKYEIAGVMTIAVAMLITISIVTYHQADQAIIKSMSNADILDVDTGPALRLQNGLGIVGAYLSHFLVDLFFGYISIIIPVLIGVYGWYIFRLYPLKQLTAVTIYSIWCMVLIASILGWFQNQELLNTLHWSGATGLAIATVLRYITGFYGSVIILSALALVTLMISVGFDLQNTIDIIKQKFAQINQQLSAKKQERYRKKQKKKEEARAKNEAQKATDPENQTQSLNRTYQEVENTREATSDEHKPEKLLGEEQEEGSSNSIDTIIERSKEEEQKRSEERKRESQSIETRPRALIEKKKMEPRDPQKPQETDEEKDIDMSVYVGEGDEEAGARDLDKQQKKEAKEVPVAKYVFPGINLLDSPDEGNGEVDMEEINRVKRIILEKLKQHNIEILSINAIVGPTVTLFEMEPAPNIKISKIESYANDLKMATAARGLRIMAPIPGRSAVGIEVPNANRQTVHIKSVINTKTFVETDFHLPVAFGKTIENDVFLIDLTKMPHLLIAGATGSGKSVGINTIITCLLYKCNPEKLKFVMIDPKKIELTLYRNIKNHFLATLPNAEEPIITDTEKALDVLNSTCKEMDERYDLLKMAMVRDIKDYNAKFKAGELDEDLGHRHLPYIVVIIDELADLMMTAGKQIEEPIARLAQLARAIGIHLVVATQRPSVKVITGNIKANFPARIAYQVASKVDSRTILDTGGADQLVGQGDMLFTNGSGMTRIQNAYVSTEEVEKITSFIGRQRGYDQPFFLKPIEEDESDGIPDPLEDRDELFEDAAKVIVRHQQGSVSLLQRKLRLGYNRAGRIIDQLYAAGVVGPYQGSTARDVLVEDEDELQETLREID